MDTKRKELVGEFMTGGNIPKDVKVTDRQMATVRPHPDAFHGDWNYALRPIANDLR